MKKVLSMVAVSVTALGLVACTPGNNTGGATVAGAAAGGLIGGGLFGGSPYAIVGGALLGGIIGNQIGQYMDRQDRANMRSAIINTPVGSQARWTNNKRDVTYEVQPIKNYRSQGNYCREYRTRVQINGNWRTAYGRACRMPDGSWKIVK